MDVLNPTTKEVVARVPMAAKEEVDAAVTNAAEAFKTRSKVSLTNRMCIMLTFQQLIREHTKGLAELVAKIATSIFATRHPKLKLFSA